MADVEVKLYLDHVKLILEQATDEVLKQLAYRVVEAAQMQIRTNDQIDTGFMVNSIYPIFDGGSDYDAAKIAAEARTIDRHGKTVDHTNDMAPEQRLPDDANAGVVVGANYAIYQEAANPFLYPGAERAGNEFGAIAERVYRQVLPNEGPKEA